MWLFVALTLVALGAAVTGFGLVAGQRSDERARVMFGAGVALFAVGTIALGIVFLIA